MVSGLSFRAISELIDAGNAQGLRSLLDTRHVNLEDRDEVRFFICFFTHHLLSKGSAESLRC